MTRRVKYYRAVWLVNWGVKSLGVTLPFPSPHSQTRSRPLTGQISRLSRRAVVLIWLRRECVVVCESRTERMSSWLWLTAALTHARVNNNTESPWRRRLPPSCSGFSGGSQCCQVRGFPPSLRNAVGLFLSSNCAGLVVKTWQSWQQVRFTDDALASDSASKNTVGLLLLI